MSSLSDWERRRGVNAYYYGGETQGGESVREDENQGQPTVHASRGMLQHCWVMRWGQDSRKASAGALEWEGPWEASHCEQ